MPQCAADIGRCWHQARYVLNLYAAGLPPTDTHHRDLVAAVLADLTRPRGKN
jgi:hypothetical protein